MKSLQVIIGMLGVCAALASPAKAATIESYSDPYMGCAARLTGVIETGDADKVKTWINAEVARRFPNDAYPPPGSALGTECRLCLDSPGGSFAEAVRIVDVIFSNLGTAVPRGATCLSACSIVFMAGSYATESDAGIVANRKLHAAGTLGFHAPSLEVSAGNYSESQVNKAYKIAVAGLGQIMARMSDMKFSQTLLAEMLKTPPEEFMYIDTVYKAGRWLIPVVGSVRPTEITALAASNACGAYYGWTGERLATNGFGFAANPKARYGWDPQITREGKQIRVEMEGFGQEGVMFCRLWITPDLAAGDEVRGSFGQYASVTIGDDDIGFEATPASFFDPRTKLVSLARPSDAELITRDVIDFTPTDRSTAKGTCIVLKGQQRLDDDPCRKETAETILSDLTRYNLETFVWPSGAKTVIETRGFTPRINGAEAKNLWSDIPEGAECVLNTGSGNTFCFQETRD